MKIFEIRVYTTNVHSKPFYFYARTSKGRKCYAEALQSSSVLLSYGEAWSNLQSKVLGLRDGEVMYGGKNYRLVRESIA